ncbi:MAG TPA: protein kinase [Chthoniobacterales bacterium]
MTRDRAAEAKDEGKALCAKCRAEIFADAPSGCCPACLLEIGLDLLTGAEADEPILGEFGDYELLAEIGRGGQGVVYRARQKSLNRVVALKVIALGHWATETHLKRFRREAEAAASLAHPCIVPIYEIGERDGACYFSMKLEEGGHLDQLVRRESVSLRRAAEIIARLARTVHYAHERGILHRDIKPGNILLDTEGEPHLADFGLARLVETESTVTRTMEVLGTPSYIAPEQAAGQSAQLTSATDVYGLGAVLYQLLTGHPPFAGGTTYETIRLVLETEPRHPRLWNSKVDRDLSTICLKCLEKDSARRYPSAEALAEDLEHWLAHEPILARRSGVFTRARKWVRRNPTTAALLPLTIALLTAIGMLFWDRFPDHPPAGIAVLPFENLDGDKANNTFADGIQDDILTKLAKVADLKVISRTSVMHYRGSQNTRQIGQALHVSYVLEGSVRRNDGRIHLNTQLIDTRTDEHVWAEEYDRSLEDVFSTQSEIAQQIADELHVQLSPTERIALAEQPTKDLRAYDLYVCGAALITAPWEPTPKEDSLRGIEFLNRAIARDPTFLLAYCRLAFAQDWFYFQNDHTPQRLALADSAVKAALRLGPNSGEAHLALALHLYWGSQDYDRARTELAVAGRTLPNDSRVSYVASLIDRRQGRWVEASRNAERAAELDPRNSQILNHVATIFFSQRDYERANAAWDRALALKPRDIALRLSRGCAELAAQADPKPVDALIGQLITDDPTMRQTLAGERFWIAYLKRDPSAASQALHAFTEGTSVDLGSNGSLALSRSFCEGLLAQLNHDSQAERVAFLAARSEQEKIAHAQPDLDWVVCVFGMIDARLGRKAEALREADRAVELMPLTRDALAGVDMLYGSAIIFAWAGEPDRAIETLARLAKIPNGPDYGDLRLDPTWDSLRGDPRFEKIVASLAPGSLAGR